MRTFQSKPGEGSELVVDHPSEVKASEWTALSLLILIRRPNIKEGGRSFRVLKGDGEIYPEPVE